MRPPSDASGDVPPRDIDSGEVSTVDLHAAEWAENEGESDGGDDDCAEMQMWVVELAGQPKFNLFRCYCAKRRWRPIRRKCDYHRADWRLILGVVIGTFQAEFGDGPVERGQVLDRIEPQIDLLLAGRRNRLERMFAGSLLIDPVLASNGQWVNGQHRSHAAQRAGATHILFGG